MLFEQKLWIGKNENKIFLLPNMANRHGLVSGATGTGKTITLKVMAESFSD
jgi:DNA helicase HerA-like ATPase